MIRVHLIARERRKGHHRRFIKRYAAVWEGSDLAMFAAYQRWLLRRDVEASFWEYHALSANYQWDSWYPSGIVKLLADAEIVEEVEVPFEKVIVVGTEHALKELRF